MGAAAWDGFLNDQDNWPAASRAEASKGSVTTARDTLGDRTFIKHKRMSPEERHLQILQAAACDRVRHTQHLRKRTDYQATGGS